MSLPNVWREMEALITRNDQQVIRVQSIRLIQQPNINLLYY